MYDDLGPALDTGRVVVDVYWVVPDCECTIRAVGGLCMTLRGAFEHAPELSVLQTPPTSHASPKGFAAEQFADDVHLGRLARSNPVVDSSRLLQVVHTGRAPKSRVRWMWQGALFHRVTARDSIPVLFLLAGSAGCLPSTRARVPIFTVSLFSRSPRAPAKTAAAHLCHRAQERSRATALRCTPRPSSLAFPLIRRVLVFLISAHPSRRTPSVPNLAILSIGAFVPAALAVSAALAAVSASTPSPALLGPCAPLLLRTIAL
mmetsp:Transcript_18956/g.55154  ORF Transcript_18956/g.55154 Transcript_18956/m.55154 type:complete len:261 (-) Transcript_18956:202-984(-)